MTKPPSQTVTQLLLAWQNGDKDALEKLTPLVYNELHRLASSYMRGEREDHTLQTTALINEAYLRLVDIKNVRWQNRAHFMGVCAKLMRRILVDFARSRKYAKRGGNTQQVPLEGWMAVAKQPSVDIVALDEALTRLSEFDVRKSRIVELRFFGGLSFKETAEVLGVSLSTIDREWSLAKAWLHKEVSSP
jgi:RNA polymerase sigma factor (TIGR02999 family)